MIKYFNIKKDCSLVLSEDKKISGSDLEKIFKDEINKSSIKITNFNKISNKQYKCSFIFDNEEYSLISIIKNITGAGWENKPRIKRVQVRNVLIDDENNIYKSNSNILNVIIGLYNYDDNPIFVAWDAYMYYNHKTQRSCYVSVDSLLQGYNREFYEGSDSNQKIWIFKGEKFDQFVNSYLFYIRENGLNE